MPLTSDEQLWSVLDPTSLTKVQQLATALRNPLITERQIYHVDIEKEKPVRMLKQCSTEQWENQKAQALREVHHPFVAIDSEGRPLLLYVPNHFSERAVAQTAAGINDLNSSLGMKSPSNDPRHPNLDVAALDRDYGPHGYGTLHCAVWMEQGHNGLGPVISREMCAGSHRLNATTRFVQSLSRVKEELSMLHAAGDPVGWRRSVDVFRKLQKYVPAAVILRSCNTDPWCSIAVSSNLPSALHLDAHDSTRILSGLCCSGTFRVSWLCLPTLGIKLRYRVRDAVAMNTSYLPHYVLWDVSDTLVTRHSMSFFNHQDVIDWVLKEYRRRKYGED